MRICIRFPRVEGLIKNKRLLQEYPDYDLYDEVANESQDSEMLRTIRVVTQYKHNLPELFDKLRRTAVKDELEASLTVSTAHRAKGLEWDAVALSDDFSFEPFHPENTREKFEDEMNLLYVACTRAMKVLAINGPVLEIMGNLLGGETERAQPVVAHAPAPLPRANGDSPRRSA